jgi:hypothetical protein
MLHGFELDALVSVGIHTSAKSKDQTQTAVSVGAVTKLTQETRPRHQILIKIDPRLPNLHLVPLEIADLQRRPRQG